jgi:hypothetical protein
MAVFLRKKGSLLILYSSGSIKFNALLGMPSENAHVNIIERSLKCCTIFMAKYKLPRNYKSK